MIPANWEEHRRSDDDALLGYLVGGADSVVPVTVFGYPLADGVPYFEAEQILDDAALGYLADPWFLQFDEVWQRVRISDVSPDLVVVTLDDDRFDEDFGTRFELPVPVDARLRHRRPD